MDKRKGTVTVVMVLSLCLLFHFEIAQAATFKVGDEAGWGPGASNWPSGKTFKAGDILEFQYNRAVHDVVLVNKGQHDSCTVPTVGTRFQTGDDFIPLRKGENYFISSFPEDCAQGVSLAVTAQ